MTARTHGPAPSKMRAAEAGAIRLKHAHDAGATPINSDGSDWAERRCAAPGRPINCTAKSRNRRIGITPDPSTQGGNMNIRETAPRMTELEKISTRTDTRDYLAKAAPTREKLKDWLVVDVDAHVNETSFWSEITDRIDNDVLRYIAESFRDRGPAPGLLNANGPLYQDVAGRIMHQQKLAEPTPPGLHRQVQLTQRAMDALGIDYMVVFPTPMLSLGMHPQVDVEVALGNAYNRWLIEQILPQDTRQKALLYLPFNDPDACVETVERFGDAPGVVGFSVTSTRHKPAWHNS